MTRHLYGWDENSEGVEHAPSPDGTVRSSYRAMAITTDGLQINNARIELLKPLRSTSCRLVAGGNVTGAHYEGCVGAEAPLRLGLDVISKLHIFVQTKEKMLFYTAANATRASAAAVTSTAEPEPTQPAK